MPESSFTVKHERTHVVCLRSKDVEYLLAQAACRMGQRPYPDIEQAGVTYTVRFEDETEGSPAYKVGIKAVVTIVEDLARLEPGI